jgi:phosphopantothenate---cysteine ligase (CTP)
LRILITAGNTLTPIDAVRGITNVFTGRTGAFIAEVAAQEGHRVELLTSHPAKCPPPAINVTAYQTFDDLAETLEEKVRDGAFDAVIHAAAVSDYRCEGVYEAESSPVEFEGQDSVSAKLQPIEGRGKISSRHEHLWLHLTPTPKLVDCIRDPWGFRGILVKFKLEVGIPESELIDRAKAARRQSGADLVVANAFETRHERAILISKDSVEIIERSELPRRLLDRIVELHASR